MAGGPLPPEGGLMTRPAGAHDPYYGIVYKKVFQLPTCRCCGKEIDPPRGKGGMPYQKCIDCLTKAPGKRSRYYRRHRQRAGKVD